MKADLPGEDEIRFESVSEDSNGNMRFLHRDASVQTAEVKITADEIRFNSDTNWAYAQGHVRLEHYITGDKVNADHAEYNLKTQNGRFYEVDGTAPAKIVASPRVLTTTNPFYFKAEWADRIKTRYILHKGYLTDCTIKKPWWTFQAPTFDIIPGQRAIGRNTIFRLKGLPIFYLPYFYRPLGKQDRHSGFLTPNIGNSTLFGYIYGIGYYWAINRSYDTTVIGQYYSLRGPAVRYDFRGKPTEKTDFDFNLYGVQDRGLVPNGGTQAQKQGGLEFELTARTEVLGFTGRLDLNYLSSFIFRQAFSYSFVSAISSEVLSVGYLQRHFRHDLYTVNILFQRDQLYTASTPLSIAPQQVLLQKLPSIEFNSRDRTISKGPVPLWFSFDTSASVLQRVEQVPTVTVAADPSNPNEPVPAKADSGAMMRVNVQPRVMTSFSFKGLTLTPSLSLGGTGYSNSYRTNTTQYSYNQACDPPCPPTPASIVAFASKALFRKDMDLSVELRLPTVERIFQVPKWMHLGTQVKHAVELSAAYEYVTGLNQFDRVIRFDTLDLFTNTNHTTMQMVNRFYKKDKKGDSREFLTWRLAQQQYFDPSFGGTVRQGARNINFVSEEFSPFAYLDGRRSYSPVVSALSLSPYSFFSLEWRAEFDPKRNRFIDHSVNGSVRYSKYFASVTDTALTTKPLLVPQSNQLTFGGGYGNANRRGWNAAATFTYDLLLGRRLYNFLQTTYNTDCCGFSLQWRRFNLGDNIRNDNQYLFSFSIANIGTFGSLQRQANIF